MGCWRRITIDDTIPVDENNHVLLPSLELPPKPPPPAAEPAAPQTQESMSVKSNKSGKSAKSAKPKQEKGKKKGAKDSPPLPVVELWPLLLCKALLKVAGLTWTPEREMVDFDIMQCLTGWIVQRISTKGKTCNSI